MRVSGVRRSCDTPASISVRCVIWRWMRSRMLMKARAAWRTSVAPSGLKFGTSRPLPRSVGGDGEAAQRAHLVAHEHRGDGQQHQRRAHHPQHEERGGRRREALPRHRDLHHAVRHLDRNEEIARIEIAVDLEGPVDALDHGLGELILGAAAGRALQPGGQGLALAEGIDQLGDVARFREQQIALGAGVGGAQRIEGEADIAGDRGRETAHHRVPNPVVEEPGREQLRAAPSAAR